MNILENLTLFFQKIEDHKIKTNNWNYRIEQYKKNFKRINGESYHLFTDRKQNIIQYILDPSGIRGNFTPHGVQITGNGFLIAKWKKIYGLSEMHDKMYFTECTKKCLSCGSYFYYKNDPNAVRADTSDIYYKNSQLACRKCYYSYKKKIDYLNIDNRVEGTIICDDKDKPFCITKFCENKCEGCNKNIKYNALDKTHINEIKQMCLKCYNLKMNL